MKDVRNERTVRYGLRDRRSGEILRVGSRTDPVDNFGVDSTETSYALCADTDQPYFTVSSAEEVSRLFAATAPGMSRHTPYMNGYEPENLEPVTIEEVVSRTIKPTGLPFDMPLRLDLRYAVDVDGWLAGEVDGLDAVMNAVETCRQDLLRKGGRFSLYGLVAAGAPGDQPEDVEDRIVMDRDGSLSARRALLALPLPAGLDHLLRRDRRPTPAEGSLVVTLGDSRRLADSLREALAEIRAGTAPKP